MMIVVVDPSSALLLKDTPKRVGYTRPNLPTPRTVPFANVPFRNKTQVLRLIPWGKKTNRIVTTVNQFDPS